MILIPRAGEEASGFYSIPVAGAGWRAVELRSTLGGDKVVGINDTGVRSTLGYS